MKKRIFITITVMALALSILSIPAMAASAQNEAEEVFNPGTRVMDDVSFYGNSGRYYYVHFHNHVVGYNQITSGPQVRVCQAFLKVAGYNPGTVDGFFGSNTNTALWNAQHGLGVVADGLCGYRTWNALYAFIGGVTNVVKSYL